MPEFTWNEISDIKHSIAHARSSIAATKMRLSLLDTELKKSFDNLEQLTTRHEKEPDEKIDTNGHVVGPDGV